ncbi:MAG: hypothetical protein R2991_16670 [Thermoanaerobaculia bacterium]
MPESAHMIPGLAVTTISLALLLAVAGVESWRVRRITAQVDEALEQRRREEREEGEEPR